MFEDKNGQLLRATLAALEEGVVVYQRDRGVVDANEAAATFLGRLSHCIHEDGTAWPPDELPVAATFATGEGHHRTIVGVELEDGERRWLSCTTTPLRDAAGEMSTSSPPSWTSQPNGPRQNGWPGGRCTTN